ncbi:MAG TPA: TonB-dependent receptor, partial [Cytophagales bacterium]|nr:TonB-dependent receptor [Cytophagales bacterium]
MLPKVDFAQGLLGTIKGTLQDTSGKSIAFETIILQHTHYAVVSDEEGKFSFVDIPAGNYMIILETGTLKFKGKEITVVEGQTTETHLIVQDSTHKLATVELVGKSKVEELLEKGYEVSVIDAKLYHNRNLEVSTLLSRASGIRVRQDAGLGSPLSLSLNGLKVAQYINGVPIEIFGVAYNINNIPIHQIDKIEIYKGVVPVHLGWDALGGAINIITRIQKNKSLDLSYTFGSFGTHKGSLYGVCRNQRTGLTAIVSSYMNRSDNNYTMQGMDVGNVKKNIRRFHDDYLSLSGRLELGVTKKKYADALLLGISVSWMKKEVQTGLMQYPVAGDATAGERNVQLSLQYTKLGLLKGKLDVNVFLLLNNRATRYTDTSSRLYLWDGSYTHRLGTKEQGELDVKQDLKTFQKDAIHRYNLNYHIHRNHALVFNHITMHSQRKNKDQWAIANNRYTGYAPDIYVKSITGLSYNSRFFHNRLQNDLFGKLYHIKTGIENGLSWEQGYFRNHGLSIKKTYAGAGLGSSFRISNKLLIKASAEYAYRIPMVYELLGDGINTLANTNLLAESSMNYNVGTLAKCIDKNGVIVNFSGSGFYRFANHFIR